VALTRRGYEGEEDYWRLRAFLREVFLLNGRQERSWQVARLDYWRWHVVENCGIGATMDEVIFFWEDAKGEIVAAVHPEGPGDVHLQVHPAFRTPALEEEMIALAEERLARPREGGRRWLQIWARQQDALRRDLLARRGYVAGAWPEVHRQRHLDGPIPVAAVAPGYAIRSLGGPEELPARSWASWRGFHEDEPDDQYDGWEWYRNLQRMPLYRRDLDLVAVAPTGEIAAFCTIWFDDVTRTGYTEPVATVPEHRRRGLGKAILTEALRRLQRMGGTLATVGGFSPAANALYGSVFSREHTLVEHWERAL